MKNSWPGALLPDWKNAGFGIYIHWPFCESKCPYCDFNSFAGQSIDQSEWGSAYLSALTNAAHDVPDRLVNSIYFGGGTPSLMDPSIVGDILDKISDIWPLANDVEVTLEANPSSVESGRFRGYSVAGVNRVSLGIQSLSQPDLSRLGRLHTVSEGLSALETAQRIFDRVSFDLIYGRQDQTLSNWESELRTAITLGSDHLSLYQLTIEPGTAFGGRHKLGKMLGLPTDDLSADMFSATHEICEGAGLQGYEVSNFARQGQESRHNLIYWRYGDFLGIGPGAHGRISIAEQRFATETSLKPEGWLSSAMTGRGYSLTERLTEQDQAAEYLMMSLRLTEGMSLSRFERLCGLHLNPQTIKDLSGDGHLAKSGDRLKATSKGRLLLNQVTGKLLQEILD